MGHIKHKLVGELVIVQLVETFCQCSTQLAIQGLHLGLLSPELAPRTDFMQSTGETACSQ